MTQPEDSPAQPDREVKGPDLATSSTPGTGPWTDLDSVAQLLAQVWSQPVTGKYDSTALPEQVGRFEVRGLAGRGGFGLVLRGYDPHMKREVALKIPRPDIPADAETRRRSLAEAQRTAGLDDARIVPVYDADDTGPIPYIVSAFCEGPDLARWLKARTSPLSARATARMMADLAEAVAYAHRRGILHLDLKPGNVLLDVTSTSDDTPTPRITDFGLGGLINVADSHFPDAPFGTPWYMAPEQTGGRSQEVGPATDIHGLGTILYELMTGTPPFYDRDRNRALERVRSEIPSLPRGDLAAIALRCLQKTPTERYASAADLANDLRRFLAGEPIQARAAPSWKRARSWARRHPVRAALIAAILVGTGATALLVFESGRRATEARWSATALSLQRLEQAGVTSLPEILTGLELTDPRAQDWLARLFAGKDQGPKLAASVALASTRPDCRDHAIEGLLNASGREVGILANLLRDRLPDLNQRLEAKLDLPRENLSGSPTETRLATHEERDRRDANAAAALIVIQQPARAWSMLRFQPDPQTRSLLIHQVGPAGIGPTVLMDRLRVETDASTRRALILAWGEAFDPDRDGSTAPEAIQYLRDRYRNDPDSGVHGACRWALQRRAPAGTLAALDQSLPREGYRDGFGWRLAKSGLTFVRVDDSSTHRSFEISDVEISREQFLRRFPNHRINLKVSPMPDCPMGNINYLEAAAFCNLLTIEEGCSPDELPYPNPPTLANIPLHGSNPKGVGYRLPTDQEFELASRAGSPCRFFFGDSPTLLDHYAWSAENAGLRTHPVAELKPNEFGIFDTLGNAFDLCQATGIEINSRRQAIYCGNSFLTRSYAMSMDQTSQIDINDQILGNDHVGFRIAQTLAVALSTRR